MKIIYSVHLNGIILISTMIILSLFTVACTCSGKKIAIKDENWRNIIHKILKKAEIDPGEIIEVEVL